MLGRILSNRQRDEIVQTANSVRRRRKALGITQVALDYESGLFVRTVDRIERGTVDHRSILSNDARVVAVMLALRRLESGKPRLKLLPQRGSKRSKSGRRVDSERIVRSEPAKLSARVVLCPDHGCWMTQAGCENLRSNNLVCRSLRGGRGCRGVKHRRLLERKRIEVNYYPPGHRGPDDGRTE